MTAAGALVRLITILIVAAALPCRAEDVISGRWEGTARIPDDELTVVVDLAQENGAWVGSIIIPGLGVKGAPLTDIKVQPPDVNFAVKGPLGIQLNLRLLDANNKLAGNFEQAGNRAPATLQKTGPPQVEYPPRNTPVAKELEGEWKGDYEMLGYTRHVSIKFANHPDGATADFVIVGRKHNVLPVDLVTQEGDLVTVDSHEMGFSFEGRLRNGKLTGAIRQARWKRRWFWCAQNDHEDFRDCRFARHVLRSDGDQRAINVSRRCDALRYVCGTCAATIPSREMEISNRRSRDFVAGFQR